MSNNMSDSLRKTYSFLTDILYPPVCILCGMPLTIEERKNKIKMHSVCSNDISFIKEPSCSVCGKQLKTGDDICKNCNESERFFEQSVAVFEYSDTVKESIYAFKYKNKREYAKTYAYLLAKKHGKTFEMWGVEAIIPIPMHAEKRKKRGYDQALTLAMETEKLLNIKAETSLLYRDKKTNPMKELGHEERRKNLRDAFKTKGASPYKSVLLIDDIYTTGTTFNECAAALKRAGVSKVYGAVLCVGKGI